MRASRARPRGDESEGARAPKRCGQFFSGSLVMAEPCFAWTPARGSSAAEGAVTSRAGLWSHPARYRGRALVVRGTAGGCRARRCQQRPASGRLARDLRRASSRQTVRTEHDCLTWAPLPAPRQTLKLGQRPSVGQGWDECRGGGRGGDRSCDIIPSMTLKRTLKRSSVYSAKGRSGPRQVSLFGTSSQRTMAKTPDAKEREIRHQKRAPRSHIATRCRA